MSNFIDSIRRNLSIVFVVASLVLIVSACGLSAESIAQQQKANDLRQSAASEGMAETINRLQIEESARRGQHQ